MYDDAIKVDGRRKRRYHTPAFKAQVVAQCLQPHVSMASVARAHNLNGNLVRRWVSDHQNGLPPQPSLVQTQAPIGNDSAQPGHDIATDIAAPTTSSAFIALPVGRMTSGLQSALPATPTTDASVVVELSSGAWQVRLHWPEQQLHTLAPWLRELVP